MTKKAANYWANRYDQIEQAANNKSKQYTRHLNGRFRAAEKSINEKIEVWYNRLADNNGIDPAEARKFLTTSELQDFKMTLHEYIEKGRENALSGQWIKELENASAKFHISRLEALKLDARHNIEMLMDNYQIGLGDLLHDVYENTYYRSLFEVQKGFNLGFNVAALNSEQIARVINKPWSVSGENFSTNIWKNKTKLINTVDKEINRLALTGEKPDAAIKNIANTFNTQYYNAKRLVYTEQAYFTSVAQNDSYSELGIEKYEFIATLDGLTCDECGELDGQVFDRKDMAIGLNAPPIHPNCRCTTAPYFDNNFRDGLRASRDEDGKTIYNISENMTFTEWKIKNEIYR